MSIWLRRLLRLLFNSFFFSFSLNILNLFYILKLQKLLVYGIFHYFILDYQLLNITSWNVHFLLIVEIITRLCVERSISSSSCLHYFWLVTDEDWRKVTVKTSLSVVDRCLFVILRFWWNLVLTTYQVLSTSIFPSTLKS